MKPHSKQVDVHSRCIGIQKGKPCEQSISPFARSHAQTELYLQRRIISTRFFNWVKRTLLCPTCRDQSHPVQKWLNEHAGPSQLQESHDRETYDVYDEHEVWLWSEISRVLGKQGQYIGGCSYQECVP